MSTPPSAQPPPRNKLRKKRSADVVSFEDLLAAHKTERGPGQLPAEGVVLIGVDLELQRRMAERIGLPEPPAPAASAPAPNIGAPKFNVNKQSHLNIGAPKFGAPRPNPESTAGAVPDRAADPEEPEFALSDLLIRRTRSKSYIVHAVSRIEDVFTSQERHLLRWLWEKGRPVPNNQRIRLVTGANGEGARRLAAQTGLIYNTFKNLTHALSTKLALDIVKPDRNLPAVYAVHHYSAILERQRLAGFTGVVHKNGGGRELVNDRAQPAPRRPDLTMDELELNIGAPKFGAPINGALLANFGAPKFGAPIRNKEYTSEKEYTTSTTVNFGAPKFVVDALFQRTGRTDADAARRITKGCVEANATVQPHEIARLIRTAQIPPNIANPVGLLIRALPGRCAPESIAHYREQWRKEDEQEKRRQQQEGAQTLETARGILDSAAKGEQWDNETLEWARSVLANDPAAGT